MQGKIFLSFLLFLLMSNFSFGQKKKHKKADKEQQQLEIAYNEAMSAIYLPGDSSSFVNILTGVSDKFYSTINEWIGTPYRYSGDSKKGIDCSGFVGMVYKTVFDVNLAQSSADMYNTDVKPKSKSNLQTGDLVFFCIRKKRVSHVGVYIGDNKFAHASVQQGVIISDLDEPYYKKYFYKAGTVKELSQYAPLAENESSVKSLLAAQENH